MERASVVGTSLADKLKAKSVQHVDNAPHLIIEARAGCGKTTVLVEGLKKVMGLDTDITPSPQQAVIWESMEQSKGARTVCFAAFNKSIAAELKNRVPPGCDAMTMHGMGYHALHNAFPKLGAPNSYRVQDIICELLEEDIRVLRMKKPTLLKATEELVGLCKMNTVEMDLRGKPYPAGELDWAGTLQELSSYYDIELNGQSEEVFALVPRVLERCKEVAKDNCIDFNDMIWLPVVLQLPVFKYDLLLVDEAQDLSCGQHALTKMAGKRLIYCGDPLQAIYGFAGADSQSMSRLEGELKQTERGCLHLPLTVTRRCGKAIVREAQKYVPDFEAFPTNPEGKISYAKFKSETTIEVKDPSRPNIKSEIDSYHRLVNDGDMILCRCNAPLVSECFRFIRQGRKANIQGRDIGAGLVKTVKKILGTKDDGSLECYSAVQLIMGVDTWLHEESKRENANRNHDESKLIALQDRHDCLMAFTDGQQTAAQVVAKIEAMFTDDKGSQGIKLSSIHKAKGLESKRVFILVPKESPLPHPMAKTAWQRAEEDHLAYVGITRSIEELIWVS
jgi:superfamily I DNA/RNA helicase